VIVSGVSDAIGDRSFGSDAELVATLGRAAADGLLAGGVLPVMKHMPGHGRATADSHLSLPVVDAHREVLERTDFASTSSSVDFRCTAPRSSLVAAAARGQGD
jgi:beta-N-acetylhexosaminidase